MFENFLRMSEPDFQLSLCDKKVKTPEEAAIYTDVLTRNQIKIKSKGPTSPLLPLVMRVMLVISPRISSTFISLVPVRQLCHKHRHLHAPHLNHGKEPSRVHIATIYSK